jgi:ribosome-binding protein aMBF1 (putative translation factor)
LSAAARDIATLDQVTEQDQDTEWISPVGRSITECIAEESSRDPKYKKYMEEPRPWFQFSQVVGIRRLELEISLGEVAKRTGIDRGVISRLERDIQAPTDEEIARLSEALDLDLTPFLPAPVERAA